MEEGEADQRRIAHALGAPAPHVGHQVGPHHQQEAEHDVQKDGEGQGVFDEQQTHEQRDSTGDETQPGVVPAEDAPAEEEHPQPGEADHHHVEGERVVADAAGEGEVEPGLESEVDGVDPLLQVTGADHLQRLPEDDGGPHDRRQGPGDEQGQGGTGEEERAQQAQRAYEGELRHIAGPAGRLQRQRYAHHRPQSEAEGEPVLPIEEAVSQPPQEAGHGRRRQRLGPLG